MNRWITSEAFHIIFICFNTLEGVIFTKSYTKTNKKNFHFQNPAFGMININIMICTFFAFFATTYSIILFFSVFFSVVPLIKCGATIQFYAYFTTEFFDQPQKAIILSLYCPYIYILNLKRKGGKKWNEEKKRSIYVI